jgi:hypothetical protein
MASPNAVFTELVSTTFRKHRRELKDGISNHNGLLKKLYKKGNYRTEDGGLTIVQPLEYAQNGTYQRYSGYDVLDIGASDTITSAEFQWRSIAMNVVSNGEELRKNSGSARIINLAKSRLTNAMRTFKNNFSMDLYSDGSLPNQINGVQALISDTGLGTVGGIDSNVWAFWRNKVQSAAAPIGGGSAITVSSATIEQLWLALYLQLTLGDDHTDLILCDENYYAMYEMSQTSLKRYTPNSQMRLNGGATSLLYKDAEVIWDSVASGMPANHAYFLNTDYFELVVHQDADLTIQDEMRSINQDATVIPILWMGNLTISNRSRQGVAKA